MEEKLDNMETAIDEYKDGYYGIGFTCKNCNNRFDKYIKKGLRIDQVLIVCPNCMSKLLSVELPRRGRRRMKPDPLN